MKQGNYYMNNMKNFRKHWVFEGSFCCIKVRFFCIIRIQIFSLRIIGKYI